MMRRAYISIGTNVDRVRHVRAGVEALRAAFGPVQISPVYETGSVGFEGRTFYNLVSAVDTALPPESLVACFKAIEDRHGRQRGGDPYSDRTLDLDLLLLGDCVLESGRLHLPRREITRHAFVLRPLADIAPDLEHPILKQTMRALWAGFDDPAQWLRPVDFPW
ncbi:2-amino-4-hydroxy-6-hydroxymethyldihydropteridine diphosphokinase [Ectothiorhodospira lacustris]|uniref:2-amino-4-hydroxy-6- hydroxymethyldihydropteridine diphosphokinase n=1 Tax=Ectothiorhodospira lacustris TaxID=2899127 RepID=UPI001EE7CC5B|nr:2-amino-4-hydroxy-6-hydroxymethyldihydropteridine diphosphokinase [Ectothiorhodospira lacustris]MCG5500905.1 2-amino-4-hydroxy-6-hydroxymethyldihydropteridine diphosphokinase [Ectothiorhodospira lacustris]MCG5510584.1 2-amino-4-hydroxy-6-hydroxymethyldihydropteridine diphosphokinase [Ectothiorhodospira lacustris]MCG5521276.1 2-amino-4-hydroxy-6-hydroxymethyldihydropteridine diphosphokinase [Ectothiorhodospira lacustris]